MSAKSQTMEKVVVYIEFILSMNRNEDIWDLSHLRLRHLKPFIFRVRTTIKELYFWHEFQNNFKMFNENDKRRM